MPYSRGCAGRRAVRLRLTGPQHRLLRGYAAGPRIQNKRPKREKAAYEVATICYPIPSPEYLSDEN